MDTKELMSRIRIQRELRGWSQEYLADCLNICAKAYSKLERGKTRLHVERLYQLAALLDLDIRDLLQPNPEREKPAVSVHSSAESLAAIKALYERLLAEKDRNIKLLQAPKS